MLQLNICPVCENDALQSFIEVSAQMHPSDDKFNYDKCPGCQLVMLNPRVALKDLKDYYTASYLPYRGAAAWGKYQSLVEKDQQRLDKRRVQLLQQQRPLDKGTTILDVGCGKPSFLHAAYQKYGIKGIGIDFSDHGWQNEPTYQQDLQLIVGELEHFELDVQPDFITMWHYLEHDYFPNQTLQHLRRIAAPNTHLIIEVPNFDSESRKKYGKHWAGWHTPRHTFLFSPNNLEQLLQNNGWTLKTIRSSGTLSDYLLYWMSAMEQQQIDWKKNMEEEFWNFAKGQTQHQFRHLFSSKKSHGIMLAIAVPTAEA